MRFSCYASFESFSYFLALQLLLLIVVVVFTWAFSENWLRRLENCGFAVKTTVDFAFKLWSDLVLCNHFGCVEVAQVHAQVVRSPACFLKLIQVFLVHEHDTGFVVFVSPAPIADMSERKVEVFTRNAHPVSYSFVDSLLWRRTISDFLARGCFFAQQNLILFFLSKWLLLLLVFNLRFVGSWLLALPKQMFGLAVEVWLRLWLQAPIAFRSSVEVVVLAVAANPPAIRKIEPLVFILLLFALMSAFSLGILPRARWFAFRDNLLLEWFRVFN